MVKLDICDLLTSQQLHNVIEAPSVYHQAITKYKPSSWSSWSLAIEANDDDNENSKKIFDESTAAVIAIYSNNESTVSSCVSIS